MSGIKLRSEKNLDDDEGRKVEAGTASLTQRYLFQEREQTLIRPDRHHDGDLEGSGDDFEPERVEGSGRISERSEAIA